MFIFPFTIFDSKYNPTTTANKFAEKISGEKKNIN